MIGDSREENTILLPVGRLDIDLSNDQDVQNCLANEKISEEIKHEIQNKHEIVLKNGSNNVIATLFSPELLAKGNGPTSGTEFYTYKNKKMKSERLYTYSLNTGSQRIAEGVTTIDVVDGIYDIVLVSAGMANVFVAIYGSAKSIWESFTDKFGTKTFTGSTRDFCEVYLIYDDIDQWTYVDMGNGNGWEIGLISGQTTITEVKGKLYAYDQNTRTGQTEIIDENHFEDIDMNTQPTKHFKNPWATAYQYASNPEYEYISWQVGRNIFKF